MQRLALVCILATTGAACTLAPSVPARSLPLNAALMLSAHNAVRAHLALPRLQWSSSLANYAQAWANTLASQAACQMHHRSEWQQDEWQVGENLFWSGPRRWTDGRIALEPVSPSRVAALWADELRDYDYASNQCRFGAQCGHYTQMVWRNTQELGCAAAACGDLGQIWVCNYYPAGNWLGQRPY